LSNTLNVEFVNNYWFEYDTHSFKNTLSLRLVFLYYPIDCLGKVFHQSGWWRRWLDIWQIFASLDKNALHAHAHGAHNVVIGVLEIEQKLEEATSD